MRIGFFSTMGGQPWGGSEELWCRTAEVLLSRGHDVSFNSQSWPEVAEPLNDLIGSGAKATFRKRRIMGRTMRSALQRLRLTRRRYTSWLRSCRPNFVAISFACHTDDP